MSLETSRNSFPSFGRIVAATLALLVTVYLITLQQFDESLIARNDEGEPAPEVIMADDGLMGQPILNDAAGSDITGSPTPVSSNHTVLIRRNYTGLRVTIGRHWGGQTCNRLLTIAVAYEFARANNASLILWDYWTKVLEEFTDLDKTVKDSSVPILFQAQMPSEAEADFKINVKEALKCSLSANSDWIRDVLRPKQEFQRGGVDAIQKVRTGLVECLGQKEGMNAPLVSVHLRRYDFVCTRNDTVRDSRRGYLKEWQACEGNPKWQRVDLDRFCKHQLDEYFMTKLKEEDPLTNYTKFGVFVSTDWQNQKLDNTFFDPNTTSSYGVVSSYRSPQQTPMAVDMWASYLSDVHVANGQTSCGVIIAMWRSKRFQNGTNKMFPKNCYEGFGRPMNSPMCFGSDYSNKLLRPR